MKMVTATFSGARAFQKTAITNVVYFKKRLLSNDSKKVAVTFIRPLSSIFKATAGEPIGLIEDVHVAEATAEVQVVPEGSIALGTAPVAADAAPVVQRAITVVEVAGGMKL